jgi:hypothetical protein
MLGLVTRSFLAVLLTQTHLCQCVAEQAPTNSLEATRPVIVNVLDPRGNAVRDLIKENFTVSLNGKPVAVSSARYSLAPRRIVVLLDISASMDDAKSSGKWLIAAEAVRDLLQQTQADVPIAMVTFAREVHTVFDFPQGRAAILNWLQENPDRPPKLKKKGTALFDAILEAVKLLGNDQPGGAIYAITDGGENASHALTQQTEHVLLQSGARLFALLIDRSFAPPVEQQAGYAFQWMVIDSGGFAFELPGPFDAEHAYHYDYDDNSREKVMTYTAELNTQIHGYWALELVAPASLKTSKVKLAVTGLTGKERKDVVVTYPRLLLSSNK